MPAFRLLDLPDELRLKLYRHILPRGERLHLDPENVEFPIPYIVDESYGEAFSLLQTCKKIHYEATQFIYANNTVNVIETDGKEDFLANLGVTACQYLSKLEVHVHEGIVDLGRIWNTMKTCPRLVDLRLVFYHERRYWSKTLAELTHYILETSNDEKLNVDLDVELHTSIWAHYQANNNYRNNFTRDLSRATRERFVKPFELPPQVRHITVTASVNRNAVFGLGGYDFHGGPWTFITLGQNDTDMRKTLRLQRGTRQPKE